MTGKELRELVARIRYETVLAKETLQRAEGNLIKLFDSIPLDFDSEKEKRGSGGEGTDP